MRGTPTEPGWLGSCPRQAAGGVSARCCPGAPLESRNLHARSGTERLEGVRGGIGLFPGPWEHWRVFWKGNCAWDPPLSPFPRRNPLLLPVAEHLPLPCAPGWGEGGAGGAAPGHSLSRGRLREAGLLASAALLPQHPVPELLG